ncbi:BglG family transcription antiterminator [Bacillus sp. FJAT-50079]|uniref:BglG family transcription antiterminator n=1 Tax=Bacillus sp. FJAT-50079 TaxID=2833577 RepID=UPI001BC98FE6|nr:BglG family transcription antiterminator [Bacillus sp. FJAT-50079]MBS4210428.1 transcription antiterminator [Bacillus sp. FJAT-50079]
MLNARENMILQELMETEQPITSEYLGNVLKVTSRTARNDIKVLDQQLNKHGAEIKSLRGIGYKLEIKDHRLFKNFLAEVSDDAMMKNGNIPTVSEDRVRYLIRRLLLADDYMKLEDLADELYVSRSTVQNDLKDVKKILNSYEIKIDVRPNYGLKVKGEEIKLRFCMSEYVFHRKESDLEIMNSQLFILSLGEMKSIQKVIIEQLKENAIVMSDIALNNLIIHIAIACKRIRDENYVSMIPQELLKITEQKEYKVAKSIVTLVEEQLQVEFPNTEIAYVAIHLMGTRTIMEAHISDKEINPFIGEGIIELTRKVIEKVEQKMGLGISDDKDLAISLSLHLKPAINRHRYRMNLRNPMLEAIKENYPLAFEAGVVAGMAIEEELGFQMNENEIAYLALHFGAAMERAKVNRNLKRCVIVCASGVGSARLLYYKLQSTMGSRLEIIGTTEYYNLINVNFDIIDFVVSTIPIRETLPVPVIEVNTILGGSDFVKIEQFLEDSSGQKAIQYLKENLVFLQQSFETKEEVLQFLCNKVEELGLVDGQFYSSVVERENISPTSFGNLVAIPHPMTPRSKETFWAICTLQKPIIWEEKRVQFICLLSIQKNGAKDLQSMYNVLGKVVDDPHLVQQLLKCKTYEEFINIF